MSGAAGTESQTGANRSIFVGGSCWRTFHGETVRVMTGRSGERHRVMLMVAPNGARRTKADHPALPITAAELAETAALCRAAGASAIHLHVRDAGGHHVLDAARYRVALAAIARRCGEGIVPQVTTEAAGRYDRRRQMALVRALRPTAVSLALRELVPDEGARTLATAARFFRRLRRDRVSPQFILYSPRETARFRRLRAAGVIVQRHPFVLFVLGRYGVAAADPGPLLDAHLAALGGGGVHWMVCAFGEREAAAALAAAARGGHVRIGFENNLLLPDGRPAADNAALVAATRRMLEAAGHQLMDGREAARIFADAAR